MQAIVIVGATVMLQLVAAFILDVAASRRGGFDVAVGIAIGSAIALQGVRFLIWGYAHRRYPLSHTYPMTALFFPFILLISYLRGDPVGAWQLMGTFIITLGVGLMSVDGARSAQ